MSDRRRAAERRGRRGEWSAALWLGLKGYRILGQRLRTPFGEIDLVALHRGVLVIVEVKARPTLAAGLEAVGPRQQQRIERAAVWLAHARGLGATPIRLDVVVTRPWRWPAHLQDAWRAQR
ncbi:MAG: YraN family protein [Alphaproteobacteria bacterium]|nr:YraN family protein [Alphaproteobacteria bacterium]